MQTTPNTAVAPRLVLPVIHHIDLETSLEQAALAFRAGADGVFLISHNGRDGSLMGVASRVKVEHQDKLVGVNLLSRSAADAFKEAHNFCLDMVWTDDPGITSDGCSHTAMQLLEAREDRSTASVLIFGSVAFKYQRPEPRPAAAALAARQWGLLPTTSGASTGSAPSVKKVRNMSEALKGGPLALASGMTPENVADFLPYATHFLVATGVSRDEHHFDADLLSRFVQTVKAYGQHPDRQIETTDWAAA